MAAGSSHRAQGTRPPPTPGFVGRSPAHLALHQVAERAARGSLGDDRFQALPAAGAAAPLDHMIERSAPSTTTTGSTPPPAPRGGGSTQAAAGPGESRLRPGRGGRLAVQSLNR
jgi:hypothetical protein